MTGLNENESRRPWFWVPSLYFSQGIPYVIVMTMSVVMYKRLGISNTDIALYTSWLYQPWVIKPLWSPLVDITRTKRFWVVAMQFLVALALALAACSVRTSSFLVWSLALFGIMALVSATHDIAADGFYMLSLSPHEQAWWVGLRSTFYRAAMIVGSGLLVVLAGVLEGRNGLPSLAISVSAGPTSPAATDSGPASIAFPEQAGDLRVVAQPGALEIARTELTATAAAAVIESSKRWNEELGFHETATASTNTTGAGRLFSVIQSSAQRVFDPPAWLWRTGVAQPLGKWLARRFPNDRAAAAPQAGNVGTLHLALSKPPAAGKNIIVNFEPRKSGLQFIGLAGGDRGSSVREGGRLVFNRNNWNQPAVVVIQLDPKLSQDATVIFQATSGDIPRAWSLTLFLVAGLFLGFSCWHSVVLPRPAADGPVVTHAKLRSEFLATLGSFFKKPGIIPALAFILLYRFDEAQLSKVISPFLLDNREAGGLGLLTGQVGLAYGTFGVLALTGGGLLGGFLAARHGLKKMLPFMIGAMYLPKLVFLLLAWTQPDNFLAICGAVATEQFGYGFGFTAFMLYLLYFADGPHKTAHYAICTGFMALGMMIPGLWSGWLADQVGYQHFFTWVIGCTLPGIVLAFRLKIDPEFGRRKP